MIRSTRIFRGYSDSLEFFEYTTIREAQEREPGIEVQLSVTQPLRGLGHKLGVECNQI